MNTKTNAAEILSYTLGDLLKLALNKASQPEKPKKTVSNQKVFKLVPKTETPKKVAKRVSNGESDSGTLVLSEETNSDGQVFLALKEPKYNHYFRGFCYHEVAKKGFGTWKWDPVRGVRLIPVGQVELLLKGLRAAYPGKTLVMGEEKIVL